VRGGEKKDEGAVASSGEEDAQDFAALLPKLKPPKSTSTDRSIAVVVAVLGVAFFAFAFGMIASVSCPVATNTTDVFDGCLAVVYPVFRVSGSSCPCFAYKCARKPLTKDNCLAAAVKQLGAKVPLSPYYVGNYSNAPKGCSVQNNSGTWAAYFNTFDGTNDYGYYTEVRRSAVACTAFQTGTFDPNVMLSLEFDRTLLNTTNANSLTDRFPRARELKLTSNRLQSFEPMVSQGVSHLERLTLEGNNLTLFTISVENFPSMRSLLLQKNELTGLPSELGGLAALTTLSVNNNRLVALPSELGGLQVLGSFDCSNNEIAFLPNELSKMVALTSLKVQKNTLISLPPSVGMLTSLTYIDFSHNHITVLPSQVGELTALGYLISNDNRLVVLPSQLGKLTLLKNLQIQDNKLVAIPAELGSLTSLTLVNLERNRIQCKVGTAVLRVVLFNPLLCYFPSSLPLFSVSDHKVCFV
jgi:hypothetical protein